VRVGIARRSGYGWRRRTAGLGLRVRGWTPTRTFTLYL
jgi:hypothetical protein